MCVIMDVLRILGFVFFSKIPSMLLDFMPSSQSGFASLEDPMYSLFDIETTLISIRVCKPYTRGCPLKPGSPAVIV